MRDIATAPSPGMRQEGMDTANRATERRRVGRLRATLSEARRLYRRSLAGVGLVLFAFFAVMTAVVTFLAGGQIGPGGTFGTPVDLASSDGIVAGLVTGADLFGIVALSLWATATAGDYSTGWVRILVQAEPRRWRLLGGKLLALSAYTMVGTAVATVISISLAPFLAGAAGISTASWSSGVVGTVAGTWLSLTMAVFVWGVIGVAIATVTRSVTAAVAGGIGYMVVVEGLLGMALDTGVTTYLPGSVLSAVVAGGTTSLGFPGAMLLGSLYGSAAVLIAGVTFTRRDVTS